MTVPSDTAQPPRDSYLEDGATLVHAINFTFEDASEIAVTRILVDNTRVLLVNPTHYTVAGGAGGVGSITKVNGGIAGATIEISRHTVRNQLVDREPGDDFPVEEQERSLDKLTRIVQELARDLLSQADIRDVVASVLSAGAGIQITVNPAGDVVTIASTIDAEFIRDVIGSTIVAGNGIQVAVDDVADQIIITNTDQANLPDCVKLSGDAQSNDGGGGGGPGPMTGEQVQDIVGALIAGGTGINVAYNDVTGVLTITNTSLAGYTDENARDAIGAALAGGARISIAVNDAGDVITISSDALDPTYAGLAVIAKGGAFNFEDIHNGRSILYTGGAAAATLRNQAAHALPDGWGNVLRNKGTGTLTIGLGAGVSVMVNGAIVAATTISIAVGGVASINRWGADDFTINGNSKVSFT
jgi:hypothetical protein